MRYYVYIIHSKLTKRSYTGITNNIDRRIKQHNQNLSNTDWTKNTTDFDIIFCTQVDNRQIARYLEIYLKSGIGREFKNLLIEDYLK